MATPTQEATRQAGNLQFVGLWLAIIVPVGGFAVWLGGGYADLVRQQTETKLTLQFLNSEVSEMKKDNKEQPARLAEAIIRAINETESPKGKR